MPASFQAGTYLPGLPAPVVTTCTPSSATTFANSSMWGFMSIRLTPKGLSVAVLAARISARRASASSPPPATRPRAPALDTAAAKAPVAMLAMPPWMMGNSVPSSSFNFITFSLSEDGRV